MPTKFAFICFIGIDGSGKTTNALSLDDYLRKNGIDSSYVWGRREPYLLKMPIKLFKRYILKEKGKTEGSEYLSIKGKRKGLFGNKIFCSLWISVSLLEYFFLIYFKLIRSQKHREVVICDRYLHDAIVDFASNCSISHTNTDTLLDNAISRWFPRPDRLYFIDISPETGTRRKTDGTSLSYLQDRVPLYRSIAVRSGAMVIDGNLPLDEIKRIICDDAVRVLKKKKSRSFNHISCNSGAL